MQQDETVAHFNKTLVLSFNKTAKMFLSYALMDVFTTTPFSGNPLAIVRVPATYKSSLSHETKQKIAVEFNLSETIFLYEPSEDCQDNADSLAIDTFTPKCEIPFAGHATIGTATYIFQNYPGLSLKVSRIW